MVTTYGARVSKVDAVVQSFKEHQQALAIQTGDELPETFLMRVSGDWRQTAQGSIGYSLIPLNGIGSDTQAAKQYVSLLIYSGKDTNEGLEGIGESIGTYFSKGADSVEFSYSADMVNVFHTCTISNLICIKF